jgi:hypothetical protein
MIVDQLTHHLPKDNEEANVQVKHLQAMLDATTVVAGFSNVAMECWVRTLTTDRVHAGSQPAVSLHRRNAAEDETGMTKTCAMSSVIEMHAAR